MRSTTRSVPSRVILTDAPGTTPPDGSLMTPAIVPVAICAKSREGVPSVSAASNEQETMRNMNPPECERRLKTALSAATATTASTSWRAGRVGEAGQAGWAGEAGQAGCAGEAGWENHL